MFDQFRSIIIFASCVVGTCNILFGQGLFSGGVLCNIFVYYENKYILQLCDRRFRRNSSLQAVCDTPIACITSCMSSLRI